ncbi:MAG: hypothetical protein AAF586_08630, partial [Planctomycetota bacterium]
SRRLLTATRRAPHAGKPASQQTEAQRRRESRPSEQCNQWPSDTLLSPCVLITLGVAFAVLPRT